MKQKLLTKTLRYYLIFSLLVVIIGAPGFYFTTEGLFIHEADEVLYLHKSEFLKTSYKTFNDADIALWNKISRDSKILVNKDPLTRDSLADQSILDSLDNEMVPYRVLFVPLKIHGRPAIFMARVSLIESDVLMKNIAFIFCAILVMLLTGLYFITRFLSAKLWRPFAVTIGQLEAFELDKNQPPVFAETDMEEFDRLNKAAANLLAKNIVIYKSQKEFVENAAHELQTPIASFLAKLDVMVQEMPITKELGDALTSLHQSASRIIRINKNLLLLSKIENDQYDSFENVSVTSVVEKQSDFIKEQMDEKGVELESIRLEPLTISANPTLLEIAVGNLLLNALRHNIPKGRINILLEKGRLSIANSGHMSLQNAEKLFQRFAAPGTSGGSGLGLAIVSKICLQHDWKLSYTFAETQHNFQITF